MLLDDITDARDAIRGGGTAAARARGAVRGRWESAVHLRHDRHRREHHRVRSAGGHRSATRRPRSIAPGPRGRASTRSSIRRCAPAPLSRLQAETDLRQAIETRAFEVYYQPIVSFDSGLIAGFEALLRWRHPVAGTGQSGGVHSDRRGYGDDSRHRALRPGGILPPDGGVAGAIRRGGARRHVREHLQPTARGRRSAGRDCGHPGADGPRAFQPEARDHGDARSSATCRGRKASSVARRRWGSSGASTISARAIRR